jgi:RsiW-degrading membrane proteinase PrsW (M82 family)
MSQNLKGILIFIAVIIGIIIVVRFFSEKEFRANTIAFIIIAFFILAFIGNCIRACN